MQLWYWRSRIRELALNEFPIRKYCLDVQGNSLMMVQTLHGRNKEVDPFLVDLVIA